LQVARRFLAMNTIGLIAGRGRFPLLVAKQIREEGCRVASCAIHEEADPSLEKLSDHTLWVKLGELGKVEDFFKKQGVREILLAGKVTKTSLFKGHIKPDLEMIRALTKIRDWKDGSLLRAVVDHLESKGIHVLDSTTFLRSCLLGPAVLTHRKPTKEEWKDIEFGFEIAKEIGRLDIGQTVVVRKQAVLAIEAIEGTDEAIKRGGTLGKEGAVVVKVSKPRQDMRFDVPAVGLSTLEAMWEVRASILALEAHKTLVLEKNEIIEFANRHRISVVLK